MKTSKLLLVSALALNLIGCGAMEDTAAGCSGDLESLCHFLVGGERDDRQDAAIDRLEDRVRQLEFKDLQLSSQLIGLENAYLRGDESVVGLINTLEAELVTVRTELVVMQTGYNIIGVVDPCGPAVGIVDEVLLRAGNGTLIASFGTGNNVRFSVLEPGNYVTTDGTGCNFTIDVNGDVTPI